SQTAYPVQRFFQLQGMRAPMVHGYRWELKSQSVESTKSQATLPPFAQLLFRDKFPRHHFLSAAKPQRTAIPAPSSKTAHETLFLRVRPQSMRNQSSLVSRIQTGIPTKMTQLFLHTVFAHKVTMRRDLLSFLAQQSCVCAPTPAPAKCHDVLENAN